MVPVSRLHQGAVLWIAGMLGVVVLTLTVVPQLLAQAHSPLPQGVLLAASLAQSGVLLALAVWMGIALSAPLGLHAPVAAAAVSGSGVWEALKPQLLPGLLAGLASGAVLMAALHFAPPEILAASAKLRIPVAARLLYGGITEEILMRWGLMTLLAWLAWRLVQKRKGVPHAACFISAILLAAVLFAIGHLPAVAAMGFQLSPDILAYVLIGNTVPGVLFGFVYWRWGLECAFLAHAIAHLVAILSGVA